MPKLFPLPLMGLNTWEVESFGSYLHRMAFEHGVYVGELIRFVCRSAVEAGLRESDHIKLPNSFDMSEILRTNQLAETLVFCFERASGQSLKSSTFINLGDVVGRSRQAIRKGFFWCPECFRSDVVLGRAPYFRLMWHLSSLQFCPIHRSRLVGTCTFCGNKQISFERKWPILLCQRCARPLSLRKKPLSPIDMTSSWEIPGADLLTLIGDLSVTRRADLSKENLNLSIEKLRQYYDFKSMSDGFYILLSRLEYKEIVFKRNKLSLNRIRRTAFKLGVSILDLISGNAEKTSDLLDSSWVDSLPLDFRSVEKSAPRNHEAIIRRVLKIVADSELPLSMKEVARRVGVSLGYLEYRHPNLMKEISFKYGAYIKESRDRKNAFACRLAKSFFSDKKYVIYRKSRKEAYRVLHAESGLPKFMLKRAIEVAYCGLT